MGMKTDPETLRRCLELAGEAAPPLVETPKTAKPRQRLAAGRSPLWTLMLRIPVGVVSEANRRDHWAVRRKRFELQANSVLLMWCLSPGHLIDWSKLLPLTVTFTHLGRKMDSDNLAGSFKACRDSLARRIGIDDGDDRIAWRYAQRPGPGGEIEVTIECRFD